MFIDIGSLIVAYTDKIFSIVQILHSGVNENRREISPRPFPTAPYQPLNCVYRIL